MKTGEAYIGSGQFLVLGKNSFERIHRSRPTLLFWTALRIMSLKLFYRCKLFRWISYSRVVSFMLFSFSSWRVKTCFFERQSIDLQGLMCLFKIANNFSIYFCFVLLWKLYLNLNARISIQHSNFKQFIFVLIFQYLSTKMVNLIWIWLRQMFVLHIFLNSKVKILCIIYIKYLDN